MIISRREALVGVKLTVFAGLNWILSGKNRALPRLDTISDDSLEVDLKRLQARIDSEEGVPMILACETVWLDQAAGQRAPIPSSLNRKVAIAFRRYADEWQRIRPNAQSADVSKIVELLAARDFTSGGAEKSL